MSYFGKRFGTGRLVTGYGPRDLKWRKKTVFWNSWTAGYDVRQPGRGGTTTFGTLLECTAKFVTRIALEHGGCHTSTFPKFKRASDLLNSFFQLLTFLNRSIILRTYEMSPPDGLTRPPVW